MSNSQNQLSQNQSKDLTAETPQAINATTQSAETEALINMAQDLVAVQTTKPDLKTKLKSRKFWLAAAGCIAGLLGMIGCSDNVIAIAIFAVLEIVSIVVYCCFCEGKVDNEHAQKLIDATMHLLEIIGGRRNAKDEADKAMQDNLDKITEPVELNDNDENVGGNDGSFLV